MSSVDAFMELNHKLQSHMKYLCGRRGYEKLYKVDVGKGILWNAYLKGLPEKVRHEHKCSCCKEFIERYGELIGIREDYGLVSIWNFEGPSLYQQSLNNMSLIAERASIKNVFVTGLDYLGKHEKTIQSTQSYIAYEDRYLSVVNQTVTTKRGREHFRVCAARLGWGEKIHRYSDNKESNMTIYKERFRSNKKQLDGILYDLSESKVEALINSLDKRENNYLRGVLLLITRGVNVNVNDKEDPRITLLEDFISLQKDYYFNIGNKRDAFCWHHAPKVEAYLEVVSSIEKELVNG